MSLADELLADLEILDDAGDERDEAQWQNEDKMEVIDELQENEAISDKSVKSITKLLDSKEVYVNKNSVKITINVRVVDGAMVTHFCLLTVQLLLGM